MATSEATVTALALTPVKAMRLRAVTRIELGPLGARGNRVFYVIDERGRLVNGKRLPALQAIVPDYDESAGELALSFPDGESVRGPVALGETVTTSFFSSDRSARVLSGPWAEALSAFGGRPLRLATAEIAVDRGRLGAVSLISRASLGRLAGEADVDEVDARRFRMLIEVDGVAAHAEDGWVGRRVRVGPALVRMHGHVGRCLVTGCDPETGESNLATLDLLGRYRRETVSTEPLPFGVYGEVLEPGAVSVGDPVSVDAG